MGIAVIPSDIQCNKFQMGVPMNYIETFPELTELIKDADHMDSKHGEGKKSMRAFIAATLSYMPGWMRFLYKIRAGFVKLLGMHQDHIPLDVSMEAEDVSLTPGDAAAFFTVVMAEDERYWVAEATDKHLSGYICILVESLQDGRSRFHVCTVVKYHHWTGPLYFNIIRPFHHLVILAMIRHAVR